MTDAQILALFLALYPDNNVKYITPDKQRQGLGTLLTELSDRIGELNLLETTDQTNLVNAINEVLFKSLKVPERLQVTNGSSIPLPAGKRGDSWYIDIVSSGLPEPNGSIWLGGLSGVIAGQKSWIIAIADTIGGDFSAVGSKYIIVNDKNGTQIVTVVDYASLPPIGEIGVLYITLDTGNTYYWDLGISDYIQIGTVVEGTLISPTVFEDLMNTPVIPDGTKIYLDTTSGIYYRWDGAAFVPIVGPTALENIIDTSTGVEVLGRLESNATVERGTATSASSSFTIDLDDPSGHYDLTLTGNTTIGFSNMIGANQSTVITLVVGGNFSLLFPSWLKPTPNNDSYYSNSASDVNLITILIRNGGGSPQGIYSLLNVDLS